MPSVSFSIKYAFVIQGGVEFNVHYFYKARVNHIFSRVPPRHTVKAALVLLSLLRKWQYSYSTSLLEGLSLSQFLSQSDDPFQASQWSRSIVIFEGEREGRVPLWLYAWLDANSQTFVETVGLLNQISNYNYSCALSTNSRNSKNAFPQAFMEAFHKRLWD